MKAEICCRLMGEAICNCPQNFKVSFNKAKILMKLVCKSILPYLFEKNYYLYERRQLMHLSFTDRSYYVMLMLH